MGKDYDDIDAEGKVLFEDILGSDNIRHLLNHTFERWDSTSGEYCDFTGSDIEDWTVIVHSFALCLYRFVSCLCYLLFGITVGPAPSVTVRDLQCLNPERATKGLWKLYVYVPWSKGERQTYY